MLALEDDYTFAQLLAATLQMFFESKQICCTATQTVDGDSLDKQLEEFVKTL